MAKQANKGTTATTGAGLAASKRAAKAPSAALQATMASIAGTSGPAIAAAIAAAPAPSTVGLRAKAAAVLAANPQGTHGGVPLAQLPPSLAAKGTSAGNLPPSVGSGAVLVRPGRPFVARSGHNAVWAALALQLASQPGGCTLAALVQGGVPAHSVAAYLRRGWLLASK